MSETLVHSVIDGLNCPDKIGLDIGANQGSYTKLLAKKLKTVYAFEPEPDNFKQLTDNVKDSNVIFVQQAAANFTGARTLFLCKQNPGGHTISSIVGNIPTWGHNPNNNMIVQMTKLDDYFPGELNIGFMKIDVEGAEEEVLRGAEKLLATNQIKIALETHDTINIPAIRVFLAGFGYNFYNEDGSVAHNVSINSHYFVHNQ
jgi:FkbM family methyltransferase